MTRTEFYDGIYYIYWFNGLYWEKIGETEDEKESIFIIKRFVKLLERYDNETYKKI